MKKLVVTIDGPAGSGKSTTAMIVAERLGYMYLDTGAMYRAITLKVLRNRVDPEDDASLEKILKNTSIEVKCTPRGLRILIDGEDVTCLLRDERISRFSSIVSALKPVRKKMIELQRKLGSGGGIVAEGRDMGSVVFPDADVKIYLDADIRTRALRRQKQLHEKGIDVELEKIEEDIKWRDEQDSKRELSPLIVPEGAIVIDTTHLTIEEQVQKVLDIVKSRMGKA